MPEISIITPCYNAGPLVGELADSLADQTFKDFDWYIVDDGSAEETLSILKVIERRQDISAHVILAGRKGGNYCRNRGFDESKGRFVKFVDADDTLGPELLREQFEVASRNENDLVVSPTKMLLTDLTSFVIPLDDKLKTDPLRSYLRKATFMHGGCLLPRKLVESADRWDEDLTAGQDLDFFRRVLATNPDVQFAGSYFIYRQHPSTGRVSNLSSKGIEKFKGQLTALDNFCEILRSQDRLDEYSVELARSYDLWGMKALALGIPFASSFIDNAKQLDPKQYRSGSAYFRFLRSLLGDRIASKLIRSRARRWLHRHLLRLGLWSRILI